MSYGEITYAGVTDGAPYAGEAGAAAPTALNPVEFHLYDRANANFIADLTATTQRKWQDPLNDAGSGSFEIHADHAVATGQLTNGSGQAAGYGDVVRCLLDGVPRFAWIVEENTKATAKAEEEVRKVLTIAGRGTLAFFENAVVYPERGINRVSADTRLFNWTSFDYDDSAWVAAQELKRWDQLIVGNSWSNDGNMAWPLNYPDPTAFWIAGPSGETVTDAPPGRVYFRKFFTLPSAVDGVMVYTADDGVDIYLDNAFIEYKNTWRQSVRQDVNLDAGTHLFAASVVNTKPENLPPGILNIVGLLFALFEKVDVSVDETDIGAMILHSDSSWLVNEYPGPNELGMTPGAVMRVLFEEAQARGALIGVTWDFTDALDSAGNAWAQTPDLGVQVGHSYYTVLRQLSEIAVDLKMDPTSLKLSAYNTRGTSKAVTLAVGDNITDAEHQGSGDISNAALMRTARGWTETSDAASISAHSRQEAFLSLGTAPSEEQGFLAAAALFTASAQPRDAIAVTHEGRSGSGEAPYTDYDVGDTITVPTRATGGSAAQRVRAITVTEDAEGSPVFVPELSSLLRERELQELRWLSRMASGTVAGQSENASPFLPSSSSLERLSPPEAIALGSGLRPATITVAASNSLDTTGADMICSGTSDQVTLSAALNALPLSVSGFDPDTRGGRVLLLEGDYHIDGPIDITGTTGNAHIVFQGQGDATRIILDADITGRVIDLASDGISHIRDLQIDGDDFAASLGGVRVDEGTTGSNEGFASIERVRVRNLDLPANTIFAFSIDQGVVTDCVADNIGAGSAFGGNTDYVILRGCFCDSVGGYAANMAGRALIDDCVFANGAGVRLAGGSSSLRGSYVTASVSAAPAVTLVSSNEDVVTGNVLVSATGHTISVDVAGPNLIASNLLRATTGQATNLDLINVTANGDRNFILGNVLYVTPAAAQPRTGIRLETGADKNAVLGNVFFNVTTQITDGGTNTQLAYTGGALGDNLSYA